MLVTCEPRAHTRDKDPSLHACQAEATLRSALGVGPVPEEDDLPEEKRNAETKHKACWARHAAPPRPTRRSCAAGSYKQCSWSLEAECGVSWGHLKTVWTWGHLKTVWLSGRLRRPHATPAACGGAAPSGRSQHSTFPLIH